MRLHKRARAEKGSAFKVCDYLNGIRPDRPSAFGEPAWLAERAPHASDEIRAEMSPEAPAAQECVARYQIEIRGRDVLELLEAIPLRHLIERLGSGEAVLAFLADAKRVLGRDPRRDEIAAIHLREGAGVAEPVES